MEFFAEVSAILNLKLADGLVLSASFFGENMKKIICLCLLIFLVNGFSFSEDKRVRYHPYGLPRHMRIIELATPGVDFYQLAMVSRQTMHDWYMEYSSYGHNYDDFYSVTLQALFQSGPFCIGMNDDDIISRLGVENLEKVKIMRKEFFGSHSPTPTGLYWTLVDSDWFYTREEFGPEVASQIGNLKVKNPDDDAAYFAENPLYLFLAFDDVVTYVNEYRKSEKTKKPMYYLLEFEMELPGEYGSSLTGYQMYVYNAFEDKMFALIFIPDRDGEYDFFHISKKSEIQGIDLLRALSEAE